MAKRTQKQATVPTAEQVAQAAAILATAQAASKAKAEAEEKANAEKAAAGSIKLSDELKARADELGHAIGAYAKEKDNAAEAYRKAAIELFSLTMEGYVGKVNPRSENFISYLALQAWTVKYPGMEFRPSQDQVMQNTLVGLRRIAKALSLEGFLMRDGQRVAVRDTLSRLLNGYTVDGKVKAGAYNPAQLKAHEYNKMHEALCASNAEYAASVNYTPPADGKKKQGREKKEPSDARMASIQADVDYMLANQCIDMVQRSTKRIVSMWPAGAPSYATLKSKAEQLLAELTTLLKDGHGKLAGEIIAGAKAATVKARDNAGKPAADTVPNVATKRKARKDRAVVRESVAAAA